MHNSVSLIVFASAFLLPVSPTFGEAPRYEPVVGDEYEIRMTYETSSEDSDGSSGNSNGVQTIVERVIGVREGGLEIEFDFPAETSAESRSRNWQLPVRVFRPSVGPMQLLNRPELEARVEAWLQAHSLTREACGRWTFTWNAFLIECDPDSVIEMLKTFDLRVEQLRDGAFYGEQEAVRPGVLKRISAEAGRETYEVELNINPEIVIRSRAESDVVVGEILGKPVTLEAALVERSKEEVSATVQITLHADLSGNVWRRTRVTEMDITLPDGRHERETARETVERLPLDSPSDP